MRCQAPLAAAAAIAAALLVAAPARAIVFNEVSRFAIDFAFDGDLTTPGTFDNPKYIGTNPLGVAWNGSKLYLAGFDNFGSFRLDGGVGLIEVLNPTRTGDITLGDADFGAKFGEIFPPAGRGYSGIAISGNRLAAAYDSGNVADPTTPSAIQTFDTATNARLWKSGDLGISTRGGSGVAFDPGFNGVLAQGSGVAWTTFGSGRRALNDPSSGAVIYNLTGPTNQGMQWIADATPANNFARDMAFDPATGDVYVRRSNDVDVATRTGANATTGRVTLINNGSDGPFQIGHKIEFLSDTEEGDLLIFNQRNANLVDYAFNDVVKVTTKTGTPVPYTFNLIGGGTSADLSLGAGIYDFDYDEATKTLAVLDYFNRNVQVFEVQETVVPITGDFNNDGQVDNGDLDLLLGNWGAASVPPAWVNGFTGPAVDNDELDSLLGNWGFGTATAVPEPTSLCLAALALAGLARRR